MGNNSAFGSFEDVFERALEQGTAVAKAGASAVKQAVQPTAKKKHTESLIRTAGAGETRGVEKMGSGANHTQLGPAQLQRLEEGYKQQDTQKVTAVRDKLSHYFKLQKQGEAEAIDYFKRLEEERKRKEEEEEAMKQQATQTIPDLVVPQGKVKRSIFSKKQKSKQSMPETRAGSGKQ